MGGLVWKGLCGCALAVCAASTALAQVAQLPEAQRAQMEAVGEDPAPKELLGITKGLHGKHYWTSNEWHLELYAPHLSALGGAYIGVGSDQAYLLMGMVRPEIAWLIDYDNDVVMLQRIYQAFFVKSATRAAFLARWHKDNRADSRKLVAGALAARADAKDHARLFGLAAGRVEHRLLRVQRTFAKAKVASFLTDDATYTWVREMSLAGRIRPLRADLLIDGAIARIGTATRAMGYSVRALYLSNAEGYWKYTPQFRKNMQSLPIDDQGRLIRTIGAWNFNFDYVYHLMPLRSFVAWVSQDYVKDFRAMVHFKWPQPGEYYAVVSPASDPKPPAPPRKLAARKKPPAAQATP